MATDYVYSVSADFPSGQVIIDNLTNEIHASPIVTSLQSITQVGDVLTITFNAALSVADKILLDANITNPAGGLIAATSLEPLTEDKVVRSAILEAAGGSLSGERTLNITGINRNVTTGTYSPLRLGTPTLPRPPAAGVLSFVSDSATESVTGAVALQVEWLDVNLNTQVAIVPTNNTTPVQVTASAWRLQKVIVAGTGTQFGSNEGTIEFTIGATNVGTIPPGIGKLQSVYHTIPAGCRAQLVGFHVSAQAAGADVVAEMQICANSPIDNPLCPEAVLHTFFTNGGSYALQSKYIPELPEKTDIYLTATSLSGGPIEVAGAFTIYERPI